MTASADRFTAEEVDELEIDGQLVHSVITLDLAHTTTVSVTRRLTSPHRTQGVVLDSSDRLLVGGVSSTRLVLWSDTAPEYVEVEALPGRLSVWNVWRDEIDQAWIGWSGIRLIPVDEAGLILRCSDGHPPGDTVDIELALGFDPPLG